MSKLPFLVSVPHAGKRIPDEVADIYILSQEEMLKDGDEGAEEIYAIKEHVAAFQTTDIARAIVDLNRAEDDFRPDGVIKTQTCWNVPIYSEFPSPESIEILLDKYYRPYHNELRQLAKKQVIVGLDCHTMSEFGPPVGPDPEKERPLLCLSNGDGTCPDEWLQKLSHCLTNEFMGERVTLNDPFKGGFIVRSHAAELPWLQIEFSRTARIANNYKREGFLRALNEWHKQIIH